jgi:hypothetical protein
MEDSKESSRGVNTEPAGSFSGETGQCICVVAKYRVRQKYLTILQNSCEWNRCRGEFVLEHTSSETQSISAAMERWSVEHRVSTVEKIFKNNDSVVVTQLIFRRHFSIHRNECP